MKLEHGLLLALTLGFAACGPTVDKPDVEEDVSVEFRLVNVGESSVFAAGAMPALYTADGEPLDHECYVNTGVVEPRHEVRPGEYLGNDQFSAESTLEECHVLSDYRGETLEAELCWATNFKGEDFSTDSELVDTQCDRATFVPGTDEVVEVEVDYTVEATEDTIPLIVENATDGSIYVQTARECGGARYYHVEYAGELLFPTGQCGLCDCSDQPCNVGCSLACEMDSVAEIPAGSERSVEMPLVYSRVYGEGADACTQQQHIPAGPLTATLCHGTKVDDSTGDGARVADETCAEVEFTLDQDEVRLVVN